MKTKMLIAAAGIAAALLAGCVQYPTERQGVVDQRPQIAFRIAADDQRLDSRVFVDGLDSGALGDYVEGKGALRVLPGTHQVRIVRGAQVLLDERVYLADGVNRTMSVR